MESPAPTVPSTARRDIAIALAVALLIRVAVLIISQRVIDMADAIHYINMARQFAQGEFLRFDENLPLLYSLLGAIGYLFLGDWEWAFWAVSLTASSCLVIPTYFIARELHGPTAARYTIALIACWPWLSDYGSRIAPEALAVTLWFGAVWLLYSGIRGSRSALIAAPLLFFALHLTRPEGTFLMLGSPIAAIILCYKNEDTATWKRLGIHTAAIISLTAVYALAMRLVVGTTTVSYRAPMSGDLLDYFTRGFVPLGETFMRLNFDVIPVMLGPLLLIFFGVGFFRYADATRKPRLEAYLLFFCAIQWGLTLANFSPAPRYLMTVVVALSLWSMKGLELTHDRIRYWPQHQWLRFIPALLIFGSFALGHAEGIAKRVLGAMPPTPVEYKTAGHWMRDNLEPGFIFSRKPQVGFYAEMPSMGPDISHTPEGLAEAAKDVGARYVVFDERYSAGILPALTPLLDDTFEHPHYTHLHTVDVYPGTRVVIFELATPGLTYLTEDEFPEISSHMGPDEQRRKKEN